MNIFTNLDPVTQGALIAACGIGVGALITAASNILSSRILRQSDERRIIYDISSKLAVEQWRLDVENNKAMNKEISDNGGVLHMPTGVNAVRIPPPQVAQTVKRIIDEIYTSTRPKSRWIRFQEWRRSRKDKAKQE